MPGARNRARGSRDRPPTLSTISDGSQTTWLPPGATAPEPAPEPQRSWRRLFGPLIVAFGLLFKYGKFALLLLPARRRSSRRPGRCSSRSPPTASSGAGSSRVGFVLLLLVHEMGHVIQLRREGIEASAPMFIPFLGAVVAAKSLGDDAAAEARVGLAGPVLGTLGAVALFRRRRVDWQRLLARARVHRLLPQPLQPAAGHAARRRARDGGDVAVDVVRRAVRWPSGSRSRSRTRSSSSSSLVGVWETFRRWKALQGRRRGAARLLPRPPEGAAAGARRVPRADRGLVLGMDALAHRADLRGRLAIRLAQRALHVALGSRAP